MVFEGQSKITDERGDRVIFASMYQRIETMSGVPRSGWEWPKESETVVRALTGK